MRAARERRSPAAVAAAPATLPFAQLPHGKEACDKAQLCLFRE